MTDYLRSKLCWILVGVTALLAGVFCVTLGNGGVKTTYAKLAGFSFGFDRINEQVSKGAALSAFDGNASISTQATDEITRLIPHCVTAAQVQAILAQHQQSCRTLAREMAQKQRNRKAACSEVRARKQPKPAAKKAERVPADKSHDKQPAPPETAPTLDEVRDAFESDLSKFLLSEHVRVDGVTLKIGGISRWNKRYIVKVEVTNGASSDFFIKEFFARSAKGRLPARAFLQLFVETGRTREGYIVFPRPETGARLLIEIRGDGEKRRMLSAPIKYPF